MRTHALRLFTLLLGSTALSAYAVTDAELKEAADAVNQQAPIMVDEHTRLDNASAGQQSLTYHYTLVNYAASDLDKTKFVEALRPNLLKAGCQTLKNLLNEGVDVNYSYSGKNKGAIASLTLTASDCNQ